MTTLRLTLLALILFSYLVCAHLQNQPVWASYVGRRNKVQVVPLASRLLDAPQDIQIAAAQISRGSESFSIEMFKTIANAVRSYETNFIISPFSIWSLMVLLAEGAVDNSKIELERTLRLPSELTHVRTAYKGFQRALVVNTTTVELAVNQALFSDVNRPINTAYANILQNDYEADHLAVNFQQLSDAVNVINNHIKEKTRGKIEKIVKNEDLQDAQLLLTSAIFFKGQWKFPFNISSTTEQPFYNEKGEYTGHVHMMAQRGTFPIALIKDLQANVLELPYGKENRLCMFVILPRRNSSLATVIENLANFSIERIYTELHQYDNNEDYEEIEVELSLPRFNIDSDLELTTVLETMGINDIFNPAKSKLTNISKEPTYVSRVFHKAIIEVNEQGTTAAAVTGGTVSFKQTPIEYVANRPFLFFIIERQTNTLLFTGQVLRPLKIE